MRLAISLIAVALAAPAGAVALVHGSPLLAGAATSAAALPDPAVAAVIFAGLGLIVGARRAGSNRRTD